MSLEGLGNMTTVANDFRNCPKVVFELACSEWQLSGLCRSAKPLDQRPLHTPIEYSRRDRSRLSDTERCSDIEPSRQSGQTAACSMVVLSSG